ncbi:hypothetical protein NDA13_001814 [Ustilago tritici]|nr:hypothetical protein NDA13_001814 [Ustilago tritici]
MDEAALRAMMPMSFGKKSVKKGPAAKMQPAAAAAASDSASTSNTGSGLGASLLGKRRAIDTEEVVLEEEEEDDDDGLTPEERAANAELERKARERRANGSSSSSASFSDESSDDEVGPPLPPGTTSTAAPPSRSNIILPPMTNTTPISGTHHKTLSALTVDASGSRFALGSYDHSLSLYDFGGLSPPLFSPFRLFEPTPNYPVLDLSFSPSSSHLLVVPGTAQAKIYTRDGAEVGECRKGDPYLRDMRNTSGHVAALSCGMFHPTDSTRFITGASDSTIRIWDLETMSRGQEGVIVMKSKSRGGRTKATAIQTTEGVTLLAAGEDGSLGHWDMRSNLGSKPRGSIDRAHEVGTITSSIAVAGNTVVTRGGDGMVKLWDLRSFRKAVVEKGGLENASPHTGVIFDPFEHNSVLTCTTCLPKNRAQSGIVVLDTVNLAPLATYPMEKEYGTPIRLHWSPVRDQLFTTTRSGTLLISHHPTRSSKGILLALSRPSCTNRSSTRLYLDPNISTSAELYPIFSGNTSDLANGVQSDSAKRRKLAKARKDERTNLPQPPISGPGKGGRIGRGAMTGVVQSMFGAPADLALDPREALLKYAKRDGDVDYTKAWKDTQPTPIYSKYSDEEERK